MHAPLFLVDPKKIVNLISGIFYGSVPLIIKMLSKPIAIYSFLTHPDQQYRQYGFESQTSGKPLPAVFSKVTQQTTNEKKDQPGKKGQKIGGGIPEDR